MKRNEFETDEEFEDRKTKRIVRIYVGFGMISIGIGMVIYTVGMIINHENKYVRYEPSDTVIEEIEEESVLKKTL